ncbi:peptidoglycan-binding protein [Salipaludibacillus neizhouensis]|uniref:Peptidoglycan-binding protein n=1 Tax=Salipaludibacillus neizhouensis TaxID=885475 RepID=A0A3A9KDW9_9BACI|nr:peptidoglycan-binding protein [Salipaludibacillus neizhouensis]RKL65675.1 peptidoglycan-binding protein [Salipaludibacillus neizhouensis]
MRNLIIGYKKSHFIGIILFVFATFFFMSPVLGEANEEAEFGDQLLIEGKNNDHVSELQELLNERGYISNSVSEGLYDSATREAVIDFQETAGIYVDGMAGTQTIGALSILEKGDEGKAVLALQHSLNSLGYYNAKLDGVFGPVTHEAVTGFQKSEGLVVDGLAGPKTYGALHKAINIQGNSSSTSVKGTETTETAVADTSESSTSDEASEQETKTEPDESSSEGEKAPEPSSSEDASEQETNTEPEESSSEEEKAPEPSSNENTNSKTEESTETSRSNQSGGRTMTVEATAYTAYCNGCSGTTATGIDLRNNPGKKVIAVDPSVIPLGSTVEVEGYGTAIAGDTGGAIKGNKIDLFMPNREDALNFGRRSLQITVLE